MNKNTTIAAIIAVTAAAYGTGCANAPADCVDNDCIEIEGAGVEASAPSFTISERDERAVAGRGDYQMVAPRTAGLYDWSLRMVDGEADACDQRFAAYHAEGYETIELQGCEQSVIAAFVQPDVLAEARNTIEAGEGFPLQVSLEAPTLEQEQLIAMGLDAAEGLPFTVEQDELVARADAFQIERMDALEAKQVSRELSQRVDPNMANNLSIR